MSLIFATQLTAIATAVLAVFAIVTAVFAILAFRKQSREVLAIECQLEVQRQQLNDQRAEQRRAQASRILFSAEPCPDPNTGRPADPVSAIVITIKNTSQRPIYRLILIFRTGDGEWTEPIDVPDWVILMPGEQEQHTISIGADIPYQFPPGHLPDRGSNHLPRRCRRALASLLRRAA